MTGRNFNRSSTPCEIGSPHLEDLEAGDIQYTDEILSLVLCLQRLVDAGHQPREHLAVDGLGQGSHRVDNLSDDNNTP